MDIQLLEAVSSVSKESEGGPKTTFSFSRGLSNGNFAFSRRSASRSMAASGKAAFKLNMCSSGGGPASLNSGISARSVRKTSMALAWMATNAASAASSFLPTSRFCNLNNRRNRSSRLGSSCVPSCQLFQVNNCRKGGFHRCAESKPASSVFPRCGPMKPRLGPSLPSA